MNSAQRRSGSAYTQNINAPSKNRAISRRGWFGIIAAVLLPPVGIYFLWREGVFQTRGRMLITTLATLEMMFLIVLVTPRAELNSVSPVPAAPPSVTAAPVGETVNALTNMFQFTNGVISIYPEIPDLKNSEKRSFPVGVTVALSTFRRNKPRLVGSSAVL